ncbi:MAG: extracellular solute-binding protein [Oscillospiraceae bacterium]|nr:extracellular solute-binding protein [Oscillospiraceae bacterium]
MKKITTITLLIIMVIYLNITLTACGNEIEDSVTYESAPPELIVADVFEPFPEYFEMLPGIDNLVLVGDVIYFTSTANFITAEFEHTGFVWRNTMIFTVNADGTNLTELINYASQIIVPQEADGAEFTILAMSVDSDGNIWVAETADFFAFDFPSDITACDADDWQFSYFRTLLGRYSAIRKLDSTGSEILTLDIGRFDAGQAFSSITDFSVDGEGNLFIATASAVHVMDSAGNELFHLDLSDHFSERIVNLYAGSVAFFRHSGQGINIQQIDTERMAWGDSTALPSNARNAESVFPGSGDFSILFIDGLNLYGADRQTGDAVRLVNLVDAFSPDTIENVLLLPDGRIMLTNEFWGVDARETDLHILTITPPAEATGVVTLRVATFFSEGQALQNAVREFNNNSTTHRIEIADYGRYDFGADGWAWGEGFNRLAMDIITGNAPDIIETVWIPFNQWAARGLFVDLNPLLDADSELNRSDLKDNVFRNTEIGGNLYMLFPGFGISTLYGHPSVVGEDMGWNWEEFNAVINAHPQADMPINFLFFIHTREEFLSDWLNRSMGNFVDWENGTAHFYRSDFAELLEFAQNFYESPDFGTVSTPDLIAAGRTIMSAGNMFAFDSLQWALWNFGGEVTFKGYPMDNRNGNFLSPVGSLSITTQSVDEDAAWEFVRIFLTEDFQRDNFEFNFPTNRAVFEYRLEQAMAENREERLDGIVIPPLTESQTQQLLDLIDSASLNRGADGSLRDIVMESVLDFINGRANVEDTVRIVQSRASIFMAEQAGW